ncbi:unnamed protein product [Bursaphelenchus okinawaensis]|uniref:Chromo domain-containing protein n=1 Tax=Bursaphelenchus okinawaensis TaxID=465554 RepID=A0A811KBX2_9BILA|nr:unnamed protein product [Bursaphelenchus okinawaensis]CAG9100564.1 unnamed protein product [Bursaphelenchus okinawaensis]
MEKADHDNNIYLVEKLTDRRWRRGRVEYLVKWLNYGDEENTWEPRANINVALCEQFDNDNGGPLMGPTSSPKKRKNDTKSNDMSPPVKKASRKLPKSRESVTPTSARRSSRRQTDESTTTTSVEPTPTPEPYIQQSNVLKLEEHLPAAESEPETSAVKLTKSDVKGSVSYNEPKTHQNLQENKGFLEPKEQDEATELEIVDKLTVTGKPDPQDDIPETFIEQTPEVLNTANTEEHLPNITSFLVPNDSHSKTHLLSVYENAPQSIEAEDTNQQNGLTTIQSSNDLGNATITDVTVNNKTSTPEFKNKMSERYGSESSSISEESVDNSALSSSDLPNWTNPALYKTRICDHYRRKSECKFGKRCWFAHGRQELRQVPRLDMHPEAEFGALAQVLETLPPSKCRDVAVSKGQKLTQLMAKNVYLHNGHLHGQYDNTSTQVSCDSIPQIERLRRQLSDMKHDRSVSHDMLSTTDLNTTFESDIMTCLPPLVVPLTKRFESETSEYDENDNLNIADLNVTLPDIHEEETHVFTECISSPIKMVECGTNTEPHYCYAEVSVRAASGLCSIDPNDFQCYLEQGGVPVRYDRRQYAFAYPE